MRGSFVFQKRIAINNNQNPEQTASDFNFYRDSVLQRDFQFLKRFLALGIMSMTKSVKGDFQNDAKRAKRHRIVIEGKEKAKKEDRSRGTILLKKR